MSDEYGALLRKVTSFTSAIESRRVADLSCRRGCADCCQVHLEVLPVEAAAIAEHLRTLDDGARTAMARRAGENEGDDCVMLEADGACAIYGARPVVCRTQGHALAYPEGVIPAEAIRGRAAADITWCPLNYTESPPDKADVLSAGLLEELVFVVNQRFAAKNGLDPEERTSLLDLARSVEPMPGPPSQGG